MNLTNMSYVRQEADAFNAELLRIVATREGEHASDKWSSNLEHYDRLFARLRNKPIAILEIGVQNGGSLETWSRYFPKATSIVGVDIDERCGRLNFEDPRIHVVIGDATSDAAEIAITKISPRFDIIIDDGSHHPADTIRALARYIPRLGQDGIYVIEDLHASYWSQFATGMYYPYSSMAFIKRLMDIVNFEHWGNGMSPAKALAAFAKKYKCSFDSESLLDIAEITIFNSMCFLTKCERGRNTLGQRIVSGTVQDVIPLNPADPWGGGSQINNVWSQYESSEEAIYEMAKKLAELRASFIWRLYRKLTRLFHAG